MGVLGMVASGVDSWDVGGRIIANVRLIYNLPGRLGGGRRLLTAAQGLAKMTEYPVCRGSLSPSLLSIFKIQI